MVPQFFGRIRICPKYYNLHGNSEKMFLDRKDNKAIAYTMKISSVAIIDIRFCQITQWLLCFGIFSSNNFVSKLLSFWPSMSMIMLLGAREQLISMLPTV